jgi:hypothetical protein
MGTTSRAPLSKLGSAADNCRTVGVWLHKRDVAGSTVRARFRQEKVVKEDGKTKINKSYDSPASLKNFKARCVTISPIGELCDPGFNP